MNPAQIVDSSAEPAFATDAQGRIIAWNQGAEKLLGYSAAEAVGHSCCDLICGRDVFGNCYCIPDCPLLRMVRDNERVFPCQLTPCNARGDGVPMRVSLFAVPASDAVSTIVIHILSPLQADADHGFEPAADRAPLGPKARLTARERDVVEALAQGKGTAGVAAALRISDHTVRNHIERISKKLGTHGRLEIVAVARRMGLIRSS